MKKLFVVMALLIFTFSNSFLFSQTLKQYSGEYSNGSDTPGKATYSYYEKDGERIKEGKFTYTKNVKSTYGYYDASITGSYKDNYKNGNWIYSITYSDYSTSYGNLYATGSIKLTSNYLDGYPNGNWSYTEINKARTKTLTGWSAYSVNPTVTVNANFNKGCLVGNFSYTNAMGTYDNGSGTIDNQGFCDGEWRFTSGRSDINEFKMQFYKKIEVSHIESKVSTGKVIDKSDFSEGEITLLKNYADRIISYSDLKNSGLKIDTNKCIENGFIDLNSTFYNSNFLIKYIVGDKSYSYDESKFKGTGCYMITSKRITYVPLSYIREYNWAMEDFKNTTSLYAQEKCLKSLKSVLEDNGKQLSEGDLELLKAQIIECEKNLKPLKLAEQKKQDEEKAKIEREAEKKKDAARIKVKTDSLEITKNELFALISEEKDNMIFKPKNYIKIEQYTVKSTNIYQADAIYYKGQILLKNFTNIYSAYLLLMEDCSKADNGLSKMSQIDKQISITKKFIPICKSDNSKSINKQLKDITDIAAIKKILNI